VDLEEKYAVALGVLSLLILGGGTVLSLSLSKAPGRVMRTVFPIAAVLTLAAFELFVVIARHNVKG
jgi:hypothetical protein